MCYLENLKATHEMEIILKFWNTRTGWVGLGRASGVALRYQNESHCENTKQKQQKMIVIVNLMTT